MTIKQFDPATCRLLAKEVEETLRDLAARHGLSVKAAGGKYGPSYYTMKVEFARMSADGTAEGPEVEAFRTLGRFYHFEPEDLGKTFVLRGTEYEVAGLRPKASKNPIIGRRKKDGREYCFPADFVRNQVRSKVA